MQLGVDGSVLTENNVTEKKHLKEAKDINVEIAVIETTNKLEAVAV